MRLINIFELLKRFTFRLLGKSQTELQSFPQDFGFRNFTVVVFINLGIKATKDFNRATAHLVLNSH